MDILATVRKLELPPDEFVVMGSAILELKGIRKAGDLDIIVAKRLFDELRKNPSWKYKCKEGKVGNVPEVESLERDDVQLYHHIYGGGDINFFLNDPTRTEIIDGIRFASLTNLLEAKSGSWDREKDRKDAELIRAYLAKEEKL